jgi:hypothetical protein
MLDSGTKYLAFNVVVLGLKNVFVKNTPTPKKII